MLMSVLQCRWTPGTDSIELCLDSSWNFAETGLHCCHVAWLFFRVGSPGHGGCVSDGTSYINVSPYSAAVHFSQRLQPFRSSNYWQQEAWLARVYRLNQHLLP